MAGLLDLFTGGDDPAKQQGILAAAAALLQAGGPSRMPISTGQGIGAALGAYQQGFQGAQDRRQEQQIGALRLKALQSQMEEDQRVRQQRQAFDQAARDSYQTPEQQALAGGGGPTMANAARIPSMTGGFDIDGFLNRASSIDPLKALELRKSFAKPADEFDTTPRVGAEADGTPFQYILSKGGKVQRLDGVLPREKADIRDLGGSIGGIDPYTGKQLFAIGKTQTPDSRAVDRRAAADRATEGGVDLSDATVDAIGQGRMQPPSGYALRNPKIANLMDRVAAKYPEFDATEYAGKSKAMRDFTTGKQGDSIRSFAVASDHLTQLKGLITALDNGNTPLVNKYANIVAQQTGSVAPTNFDAAKGIVAKEVLKSIVAGGGGVEERQELAHLLDNAKTGKQLGGVVDTYLHLMGAQRDGLMRQYELSTGRKDGAQRFNYQQGGGDAGTAPKPQAKVDMLPNAAQAAGRRYRADNGTIYRSDGTKWIKE